MALKRDIRTDFPQWNENKAPQMIAYQRDLHALLLVEDENIPVGAVSFAWTIWSDAEPDWHMLFAWVADEWRRKGVMSRRWPHWRSTYGDFTLEHPLSDAMEVFVAARASRIGAVA